jgi:hypothetical protein
MDLWPPFSGFLDHTHRDTRYDSSGWVINSSQRPLPTQDNTTYRHNRQTSMSERNSNPRPQQPSGCRPRGHWDRLIICITLPNKLGDGPAQAANKLQIRPRIEYYNKTADTRKRGQRRWVSRESPELNLWRVPNNTDNTQVSFNVLYSTLEMYSLFLPWGFLVFCRVGTCILSTVLFTIKVDTITD